MQNFKKAPDGYDDRLAKYIDFENGFFIEAGANDGINQSNTYYLEKAKNWSGILVEGIPELFEKCVNNRPGSKVFNRALVSSKNTASTVKMKYANLMSLVEGAMKSKEEETEHINTGVRVQNLPRSYEVQVQTSTLDALLEVTLGDRQIDFISLDVEGFELEVLRGLNLIKYKPSYILIEARYFNEIDYYLRLNHYEIAERFLKSDILYRRKGTKELAKPKKQAEASPVPTEGKVSEEPKKELVGAESKKALVQSLVPYFDELGWFASKQKRLPIDQHSRPIPWFTYAAIRFFESRIKESMNVFEYGSGHSTLWWSERVSQVVSYEHDQRWFNQIKPKLRNNVEYNFEALEKGGAYCQAIRKFTNQFDIIVIDGRDRVNCAKNSIQALKENGVIIWDNSDRDFYQEGYDFLIGNSFKRLDFEGLGPINSYSWCTSLFYRQNNCLGV